uniref:Uncharacterized protein n=1 Tax=Peronospora matthiolae TaxID=2874970 RepID=A0AAV1TPG8_9STRA
MVTAASPAFTNIKDLENRGRQAMLQLGLLGQRPLSTMQVLVKQRLDLDLRTVSRIPVTTLLQAHRSDDDEISAARAGGTYGNGVVKTCSCLNRCTVDQVQGAAVLKRLCENDGLKSRRAGRT